MGQLLTRFHLARFHLARFRLAKFYLALVIMALTSHAVSAPATTEPSVILDQQEQAWLKTHPVIRIAPDPDFAPVGWFNKVGNYQGMNSNYIGLLENKLGIVFEVVRARDWQSVLDMARREEVDIVTPIARTSQREAYLLFSNTYINMKGVIVSNKDLPQVHSLADLKGYKVAVVEGYLWDDELTPFQDVIDIDRFHDLQTALISTSRGVTDVTVSALDSIRFESRKEGILNLKVVAELQKEINLNFGVRKDWPQLVSILNKSLASISPSERTAIREQWVGLNTSRFWENPVYKYTALAVLGFLLLLVVAVTIWNRMLNARVRQRTQALKNAQMQLIQAEKLESIGRLAAGVAHEVKNPLAIIQMGADYLSQEMPTDEITREVINDIDDAVRRADTVVKGLLDFSHDEELGLKQGNINQAIESSLHLVDHEMRQRNIEVILNLAENVPDINLDANKLQQVLINLFMNSAHAMEREGKLFVSSCLRTLDARSDLAGDHENRFNLGDTVLWVEIEDTGTGVKEADKAKIFDPFYTTKPVGEGTGLGLSVSQNIINLHKGTINIRNRKEGGASVVIMFKVKVGDNE